MTCNEERAADRRRELRLMTQVMGSAPVMTQVMGGVLDDTAIEVV